MPSATKPTLVFIPGFWEGPHVYASVITTLASHGYLTLTIPLSSTGTTPPNNPSLYDDVAAIRTALIGILDDGPHDREVVLVMHSGGAFLGSDAIEGLGLPARAAEGKAGGIKRLVFLAGAIWEEGFEHGPLAFFDYDGRKMYCANPSTLLFNDLPPSTHAKYMATFTHQPASGWDGVIKYGGWKAVPSTYLVCEGDAVLPAGLQRQMAERAGSDVLESCEAGHMVMLSQPGKVVEVVRRAAGEGGLLD